MATGSGKTYVMALLIAWSALRRRLEGATDLADNALIIAPNVIVFERLEQDSAAGRIFHELPIVPPEWRHQFALQTILRGDARDPGPHGNLFLTNIQQLSPSRTLSGSLRRKAWASVPSRPRPSPASRCSRWRTGPAWTSPSPTPAPSTPAPTAISPPSIPWSSPRLARPLTWRSRSASRLTSSMERWTCAWPRVRWSSTPTMCPRSRICWRPSP